MLLKSVSQRFWIIIVYLTILSLFKEHNNKPLLKDSFFPNFLHLINILDSFIGRISLLKLISSLCL